MAGAPQLPRLTHGAPSTPSPLADTFGYGPLFALLGVFDLVGAAALIVLIGGERQAERFAAA
jgi:hypothetical protein